MKTFVKIFTTTALLVAYSFIALHAKTVEITIPNVRNDKGNLLVMANIPGADKPVYEMAKAQKGTVTILLNLEAETAEVSLFHDENGDYQMAKDEKGIPAEGYAMKKCKLPEEHNAIVLKLTYPAAF